MLPRVVPSARVFTFNWDAEYYKNAPVVRIQDVADTLLRKLQDERDKVGNQYIFNGLSDSRYRRIRTRGP